MNATWQIDLGLAARFALVLARVAAVISLTPVLGGSVVPRPVKVGLSVAIALLLFPRLTAVGAPANLLALAVGVGGEIVVGALIGFVVAALFAGVQLAGQTIAAQMGFAAASQFDPMTHANSMVVGQFQFVLAGLIFFALGGHLRVIEALAASFTRVPLAAAHLGGGALQELFDLTEAVFVAGLSIAAPVIAAMILTHIGLGILARTLPQMNVFLVAFPLQIAVGLATLGLTLPLLAWWMGRGVNEMDGHFVHLLSSLS
ncbi:MAG: flagellar biosynthetic protein FliR [Nitrospirae bacterium CG18_big_fil_WC_8_21_14_2_50_70_55]|nr:flagellar biosynthetic protein FliR [Deltaproteobacteria bacterium]OIP66658.1 MAG: flagellar biosynthetic protein FliR [Nitrospirae bacterium CG2_30_70_394]PIQ07120.1 MAG: flagellar biosynthetic protein FliR [Nitrospirae bacterium CG18_big_fil_WC_8_21_14_2_50_70_55]PIU77392.1 MAG: flagellar biosynthetic protein FliR [Nitrospirae bacterium CG06_land_8_20_14_3_00_70_43]PIW81981.1 MAG: flagellar biosynthetic protein FliR [Nitrospirae bacterium CG_4_8_14_3_um_filter_70_85]PIX83299.1 MAG: flagel